MKTRLRMKCKACGHWNRFEVNKLFIEQPSSEAKVKVLIPMYEPLKTETCKKCKSVIAEPKELIKIIKT
jgi:RNase P subunit RPR2